MVIKTRATLIGDKWILEPIQTPHQNPPSNASWDDVQRRCLLMERGYLPTTSWICMGHGGTKLCMCTILW